MTHLNDTYLAIGHVSARLGVSRPTLYRWIARGDFPRGHHFSVGCRRWKLSDILNWEATRGAGTTMPTIPAETDAVHSATAKAA
jgi:predicted DNA-binding transcriptional regulator AlpA